MRHFAETPAAANSEIDMKIRIPIPFTNIEIKSHDPESAPPTNGVWQQSFGPIPLKLKDRRPPPNRRPAPPSRPPVLVTSLAPSGDALSPDAIVNAGCANAQRKENEDAKKTSDALVKVTEEFGNLPKVESLLTESDKPENRIQVNLGTRPLQISVTKPLEASAATPVAGGSGTASSSQTGPTATPVASGSQIPPRMQARLDLAALFMGRAMTGFPIENPRLLERMRRMTDSMQTTRGHLFAGRGNSWQDIQASGGDSNHRAEVARTITAESVGEHPDPMQGSMIEAAAAGMTGGGNCGEHASKLFFEHAPKLLPGETLTLEDVLIDEVLGGDHAYVSTKMEGHLDDLDHIIHGDAWKDGSPVPRSDAPASIARAHISIGHAESANITQQYAQTAASLQNTYGGRVPQMLQNQRTNEVTPDGAFVQIPQAVSAEFAQEVREAMAGVDAGELREEAIFACLDAGLTQVQANHFAQRVIDSARRLDQVRHDRVNLPPHGGSGAGGSSSSV